MKIAALADLHGYLPRVPSCDVVIIAGDICPDRYAPFHRLVEDQQRLWFAQQARPWLESLDAPHKLLTWGNHDWCGERCVMSSGDGLRILVDQEVTITMGDYALSVWMTPWSNQFMNWAFMQQPERLGVIYAGIPPGIDVLVSHQPPRGVGDQVHGHGPHLGSLELLEAIRRVKPKLVICGHIHGGRGAYDVDGIPVYNVSVVNDAYQLVHEPVVLNVETDGDVSVDERCRVEDADGTTRRPAGDAGRAASKNQ